MSFIDAPNYLSQTASILVPKASYLSLEGGYEPRVGDSLSSREGSLIGENLVNVEIKRQFFLEFFFTPPQLRTDFTVNDLIVSLPTSELTFSGEAEVFNYEFDAEMGWLVAIVLAGATYFSSPITAATGTILGKELEVENDKPTLHVPSISQTVQFQPQIKVQPGSTFGAYAVPYYRIIEVVKLEKGGHLFLRPSGTGTVPFHPRKALTASATVVYSAYFKK